MRVDVKLGKLDFINVAGSVLALVGFILTAIGCAVFSVPEGIGVNFNLSPLVYAGAGIMGAGLIAAIVGNVLYRNHDMNRIAASTALYVATIAILVAIVIIALTILMPVINPSNG